MLFASAVYWMIRAAFTAVPALWYCPPPAHVFPANGFISDPSLPYHTDRGMNRTYLILPASMIFLACGGGEGTPSDESSNMQAAQEDCAAADTTPVMLATLDYINSADPRPQRFLSAAGTDSAMPDDGFKILQDKGPSFFYAGSEAALKKLRDKLDFDGPFPSMLVVLKDQQTADDGTVQITLAGHYIAGTLHGTASPPRTYTYRCADGKWSADASQRAAGE